MPSIQFFKNSKPCASASRDSTIRCVMGKTLACPSPCSKPENEITTFGPKSDTCAMPVQNIKGGIFGSCAMGIPAVKAGVVESECCHGRVPAHYSLTPAAISKLILSISACSACSAAASSEAVGVVMEQTIFFCPQFVSTYGYITTRGVMER